MSSRTRPTVRRCLRRCLPALSIAALVGTAACKTPLTWGAFSEDACNGDSFSLPVAFTPAFDYAELRRTDGAVPGAKSTIASSAGDKCKGAKEREACLARVTEARSDDGFSNGSYGRMPGHMYLVATRGDEVVVVNTAASAGKALAPIDAPAKAAALAALVTALTPACKGSVRRASGGYEVHLKSTSCRGPREVLLRVEADGTSRVLKEESKPGTCVGRVVAERSQAEPG